MIETPSIKLLDYLYRLRLRSNYEDSTMFTDGPERTSDSRQVHRSLCRITSATALIHELFIQKLIGPARFDAIADDWLAASGSPARAVGLGSRRELLTLGG